MSEILLRHRCPKQTQTDGGKPYILSGINSFFAKHNTAYEVSAPYHPESNGMAERLTQYLKDRLFHVNEDQGLDLRINLNVAVSAYRMVPHCALGFLPFVLLYGHEAITPYEIPFNWYDSEEQYQNALGSHIEKYLNSTRGCSSKLENTR